MEETINEFKEKCYISVAKLPSKVCCQKTLQKQAVKVFLQGKKYLEANNIQLAAHCLLYAKELYVLQYGKLANECREIYFFCGKALYYLAWEETIAIIRKRKNKAEKRDKKEMELSESTDSPLAVFDEDSTDTKVKIESSEYMKEAGFSLQEEYCVAAYCQACGRGVAEESKMGEEGRLITKRRLSDYHRKLAWKFLEDAKMMFERQDTVEAELKVAETLQLFGGIYNDNANYFSAIQEFEKSLNICKKHLKPGDELFTDVVRNLAIAYKNAEMFPEALYYFQISKRMLEVQYENLRNTIVDADTALKLKVEDDIFDLHLRLEDTETSIEDIENMMET